MKACEIFANEETKRAACQFALECIKDDEFYDDDKFKNIRDAFIAGAVWKQMTATNN